MAFAARIQDPTDHGGTLKGAGVASVRIDGQPAAVANDPRVIHACPITTSTPPHASSTVLVGSSSVTIGGCPAARVGDKLACGASIQSGASSVRIGG